MTMQQLRSLPRKREPSSLAKHWVPAFRRDERDDSIQNDCALGFAGEISDLRIEFGRALEARLGVAGAAERLQRHPALAVRRRHPRRKPDRPVAIAERLGRL